jgi:hypothetical protein
MFGSIVFGSVVKYYIMEETWGRRSYLPHGDRKEKRERQKGAIVSILPLRGTSNDLISSHQTHLLEFTPS